MKLKFLPRFLVTSTLSGIAAVSAWYLWRRWSLPLQVDEQEMVASGGTLGELPAGILAGEVPLQLLKQGHGPLYVRSYQVDICHPQKTSQQIVEAMIADINQFVPKELASFEKTKGILNKLEVGDEFFVHIAGPWDGPVRVIACGETSFAFATLENHLEAGEIRFSAEPHPDRSDTIRFRIQSWARSSNAVTDLFYRVVGLSKFMQTTMWAQFCKRVVEQSGGELLDKINVMTHSVPEQYISAQMPLWKQYSPQFDRWHNASLNFDINRVEEFTVANGWQIDDYSIGLPGEPAGEPLPNGSFEIAREIVNNYEFPDPKLLTGIFVPDQPLADRLMIIRAQFLFFTFWFGVRIAGVIDETRATEKRGNARVCGYSYRTLEGHFEMGEITFEVWKFLESGDVEFRIHAYSKTGWIRNPFYRIGFWLFGRSLQLRFARTALARMQQLVVARLAEAPHTDPVETPEVTSVRSDDAAQEKAQEIEATGS
ncbi:MAG: DUF1990 family protein [Anaerolineae bacterium]|nr:DUF1990 family protein [Anaerolineae bacterium]